MALNPHIGNNEVRGGKLSFECRPEEKTTEPELKILESEVKQIAAKIVEYRTELPGLLSNTLNSLLAAQRPEVFALRSPKPDAVEGDKSDGGMSFREEDQETTEKIQSLKEKVSSNISAMPIVLKRMKDCIAKIDKLEPYNGTIYPVFKKTKTSRACFIFNCMPKSSC